jgi:hypothetical protein
MSVSGQSLLGRLKTLLVGRARDLQDRSIFHRLTLAAFLAWVGLGSDGLSSSCYGPPEAFIALHGHAHLGLFVALATALTVLTISASYSGTKGERQREHQSPGNQGRNRCAATIRPAGGCLSVSSRDTAASLCDVSLDLERRQGYGAA